MKILILTLLASSALAARPGARIIGGRNANAGEFPFAAAVLTQTGTGSYFCGGALLSNQWVISSATCLDGGVLFQIRLGVNEWESTEALRLSTDIYYLHPSYNADTLNNDVGLLEFRLPITLTDYIQPIRLPGRDVQSYAIVTAIGWGQTSDSDPGLVPNLQAVLLTALSNEECRLYFGTQVTETMVCVDGNFNQGTCVGDTGGPLIQYVNGHQATLVGVASFLSGNGCETTDPSGFARIVPQIEWIRGVTGIV